MDENFDKSQLKTLCRGNRTDRGWSQTAEGNWVPSVHDRRRAAVSHMQMVAEVNHLPGLPRAAVLGVIARHAHQGDGVKIVANFDRWMQAAQG